MQKNKTISRVLSVLGLVMFLVYTITGYYQVYGLFFYLIPVFLLILSTGLFDFKIWIYLMINLIIMSIIGFILIVSVRNQIEINEVIPPSIIN